MKTNKFFIYDYDQWINLNDTRIAAIQESKFNELLKSNCKKYSVTFPQLYKKLAIDDPYCFISSETLLDNKTVCELNHINPTNWKILPDIQKSINCYNYQISVPGNLYVLIPFDGANFAICPGPELSSIKLQDSIELIDQGFTRAYYNDPIKWLKGLNKREMWTNSASLLINYEVWKKLT